jgi:hypothetical protein
MMRWRVGVSRYKGAPIPRANLIGRGCGVPAGWPDRGGSIARARPTPAQSVEHQQRLRRFGSRLYDFHSRVVATNSVITVTAASWWASGGVGYAGAGFRRAFHTPH